MLKDVNKKMDNEIIIRINSWQEALDKIKGFEK